MLAGAVLVLFFLSLGPFWSGPFWFAWAVFDLHWGRFGDGPFWSVPIGATFHPCRAKSLFLDYWVKTIRNIFVPSSEATALWRYTSFIIIIIIIIINDSFSFTDLSNLFLWTFVIFNKRWTNNKRFINAFLGNNNKCFFTNVYYI